MPAATGDESIIASETRCYSIYVCHRNAKMFAEKAKRHYNEKPPRAN